MQIKRITKARRVPTVREVIKAAREILWESVGRIDLGIRQYEEGGQGTDETKWCTSPSDTYSPDTDLIDFEPLRDLLQRVRRGDKLTSCRPSPPAMFAADCYVYSTDEYTGLIDNLDLAIIGGEWYLLALSVADWDRYFKGRTRGEGYEAIAAEITAEEAL